MQVFHCITVSRCRTSVYNNFESLKKIDVTGILLIHPRCYARDVLSRKPFEMERPSTGATYSSHGDAHLTSTTGIDSVVSKVIGVKRFS